MTPVGDSAKTFALWRECNQFKNALDDEIQVAETKLAAIKPLNSRLRSDSKTSETSSWKVYALYAKAYKTYATGIRSANSERADPILIYHILNEATAAEELSGIYQQVATAVADQGADRRVEDSSVEVKLKVLSELRNKYDALRLNLSLRHGRDLPTLEETRKESKVPSAGTGDGNANRRSPRTVTDWWTSSNGKHKIKAKLVKVENGVVTLKTSKGKTITVEVEKLSDEDQEFLENQEDASSSGDKEDKGDKDERFVVDTSPGLGPPIPRVAEVPVHRPQREFGDHRHPSLVVVAADHRRPRG